mmetsp:Transcript_348/g.641  ORF Transcript_348/g.641 Transcript_348/m.641 type:complete len:128 (+) Transcript_348:140-523(+)|eukprot:CAMPEP_0203747532 /NCGR_PEP_ID=MMETSP0098-20131031/2651_1 /ASSEMBLY_ACC=CAM_ASM_000208 /TAXON_ID=96639 /ORGANISM=" , Strain NY0313808BC1" /LENGTH=127 /DNA_ID=CAMNT_0050635981 /DNA_START=94 /DNA_END=477 /DNA_ORIENTATION=+
MSYTNFDRVVKENMLAFEKYYNLDETSKAAALYSSECLVTVNGGIENGGPFTGKTTADVATFLNALRNEMGATNMRFTITSAANGEHTDTWTCDSGTGSCKATWEEQSDGQWKITRDEITFVPKTTT